MEDSKAIGNNKEFDTVEKPPVTGCNLITEQGL